MSKRNFTVHGYEASGFGKSTLNTGLDIDGISQVEYIYKYICTLFFS